MNSVYDLSVKRRAKFQGVVVVAMIERQGEVVIVHLRGRIDYESTEPFRRHCAANLIHEKVVFNLRELNFVGSIGVTDFVGIIGELFNQSGGGIKLGGVTNEFRRLFEALCPKDLQIFDTAASAVRSFQGLSVSPLSRLTPVSEVGSETAGS